MTAPEGTSPARMTGLAIAGILLLFAAQLALRFSSSLIHDSAWYLYVAQGLLQGKKLYVDFVEVNPPLGMWLALPAAWAGQVTGASAVGWFYALLFAATAAVLGLSWRYLDEGEHKPLLLVPSPLCCSLHRATILASVSISCCSWFCPGCCCGCRPAQAPGGGKGRWWVPWQHLASP